MIYDVHRLTENYLRELPETCEGILLETLENRVRVDILGSRQTAFTVEGILRQADWYKHHHRLPNGGIELQARRCYCNNESAEICEQRKNIPSSTQLPEITPDYDTNLQAAFWNWVCNRRTDDHPRGDFIRDTRILLEIGTNPSTRLFSASTEAVQEYIELRTRWAAEVGVHPSDCRPLDGRGKVSGTGWYYCCPQCNNCDCDGSNGCDCDCTACSPDC